MRTKPIGFALTLCFLAAAPCLADEQMGTWKLNESKSKITPGMTKNHTMVYEAVGDKIKLTVDGTDKNGNATHNEWTGKFDGKDYPVTGHPTSDMRSYKRVNDRTLELTAKKDGKVTTTGRIVVSPDGKIRTVTVSGTDADGKDFTNRTIYDKQ